MPIERYTVAHGTEAEWADETRPLAVGEPGMATDSNTFALGDGETLWGGLPKFYPTDTAAAQIDDSAIPQDPSQPYSYPVKGSGSGSTTLSSQAIISLANAVYAAAVAAAQQAVQGAGGARVVPVFQNADGTWPNSTAPVGSISLWIGTVGTTAPPAGDNDLVILKDAS